MIVPMFNNRFIPTRGNDSSGIFNMINRVDLNDFFSLALRRFNVTLFRRHRFFRSFSFGVRRILFRGLPNVSPSRNDRLINLTVIPRNDVRTMTIITTGLRRFERINHTTRSKRTQALSKIIRTGPTSASRNVQGPITRLSSNEMHALQRNRITINYRNALLRNVRRLCLIDARPQINAQTNGNVDLSNFSILSDRFRIFHCTPFHAFVHLTRMDRRINVTSFLFQFCARQRFLVIRTGLRQEDRYTRGRRLTSTRYLRLTRVIQPPMNFPRLRQFLTVPRLRFLNCTRRIFEYRVIAYVLRIRYTSA